jgi:hypothetical protein
MRYMPDGDITAPGLLFSVDGFAPNNNGAYRRIDACQDTGYAALTTGRCLGSAVVKNLAGTAKLYAGSTTKIYQADGAANWTDRSGGVTFAATTWAFAAFGDNVIAANGASKLQVAVAGNFADITDAPTGCKIVYPHGNALIALSSTANGAGWYRCVSGDHTTWTATASNDADSGTLYGSIGGPIVAGGPWENLALAWKSRAMYAGIFVGNSDPDQEVIRWQIVATDVGCVSQFGWVATEKGVVFVSERGIMLFNGNKPFNIDDDIRATFMREAMTNRSRIFCTVDEGKNQVFVWYSPSGSNGCSAAMVWNYKTGLWGRVATLQDGTAITFGQPKTPVRNANYRDLVSIGGFATNTMETANLWFDHTNDRLINQASVTYGGSDNTIRTGMLGFPDKSTTLRRVYLVSDSYSGGNSCDTVTVNAYTGTGGSGTSKVVSDQLNGWFDIGMTANYFEMRFNFTTAEGTASLQKMIVEFEEAGPSFKRSSVEL